jgi:hypothetical protein
MAERGLESLQEITVLLSIETSAGLLVEAERRCIPRESLIAKLLSAIVADNLYAAVLDP